MVTGLSNAQLQRDDQAGCVLFVPIGRARERRDLDAAAGRTVGDLLGSDVFPAACGPINRFGSEESGRAFTERAGGLLLLTLDEGFELVRLIDRAAFGSALERDAAEPTDKEL